MCDFGNPLSVGSFGLLGGPANDGGAAAATRLEHQRQGQANNLANYVQTVFEGGTAPVYTAVAPGGTLQEGQTYFKQNGGGAFVGTVPKYGNYSKLGTNATLQKGGTYYTKGKGGIFSQVSDPSQLNNLLATGSLYYRPVKGGGTRNLFTMADVTSPGYTDANTYDKIKQDYIDYAMPQYQTQLGQTQRNLAGNLASRGLVGSSIAQTAADALSSDAALQRQQIVDSGQNLANTTKQQMSAQESALIDQVLQSSDPANAAANALQTAATFSQPSQFAPLGQLFQNYANTYLINQAAQPVSSYSVPYGYNPYGVSGLSTSYIPKN